MELYEMELEDARKRIAALGGKPGDFTFEMEYLPPDPDGGGMFTVQYQVGITYVPNGKTLGVIGGIGMGWVDWFEEALKDGHFD